MRGYYGIMARGEFLTGCTPVGMNDQGSTVYEANPAGTRKVIPGPEEMQ